MKVNKPEFKISIVIPVYNAQNYISHLIESLKAQTFKELEFIFVDDCSEDESMLQVEDWAKDDARVRIIRNEVNLGEGGSRNRGLEAARGLYINTIDPDDWVAPDFYELLWNKAVETSADIVKGTRIKIKEISMKELEPRSKLNAYIDSGLAKGEPLYWLLHYEHQTIIFKRSLLDDEIRYGKATNAADTTFLTCLCLKACSFATENKAYYYYLQRTGSATAEFTLKRSKNELISLEEIFSHLLQKGMINKYTYRYALTLGYHGFAMRFVYAYEKGNISVKDKEQYIKDLKKQFMRFPDYEIFYDLVPEMYALIELNKLLPKELGEDIKSCKEEVADWMCYVWALKGEQREAAVKKFVGKLTAYLKKRKTAGADPQILNKEICEMKAGIKGFRQRREFKVIAKEAILSSQTGK